MYKSLKSVLFVLLTLLPVNARSQERSIGLFNSPKGFGVSLCLNRDQDNEFASFDLYADMYGVYSGRASGPGIKVRASKERVWASRDLTVAKCLFHTGPGLSAGYVRDWSKDGDAHAGIEFSLLADGGCMFLFGRGFSLDISLSLELGLFVRTSGGTSIYKNGGLQFLCPQLKICRNF